VFGHEQTIPWSRQISQSARLRDGIFIQVSASDRAQLEGFIADRDTPSKIVWRPKIVLATADGLGTMAIMRCAGKSKPCGAEGVHGMTQDGECRFSFEREAKD
jgi:hypothetical protein